MLKNNAAFLTRTWISKPTEGVSSISTFENTTLPTLLKGPIVIPIPLPEQPSFFAVQFPPKMWTPSRVRPTGSPPGASANGSSGS